MAFQANIGGTGYLSQLTVAEFDTRLPFVWMTWVRDRAATQDGQGTYISAQNGSFTNMIRFGVHDNGTTLGLHLGQPFAFASSSEVVTDNVWIHYTMVREATNGDVVLYKNGTEIARGFLNATSFSHADNIGVGLIPFVGEPVEADFAYMKYWEDRTLTPTEILAEMTSATPIITDDLFDYWLFDGTVDGELGHDWTIEGGGVDYTDDPTLPAGGGEEVESGQVEISGATEVAVVATHNALSGNAQVDALGSVVVDGVVTVFSGSIAVEAATLTVSDSFVEKTSGVIEVNGATLIASDGLQIVLSGISQFEATSGVVADAVTGSLVFSGQVEVTAVNELAANGYQTVTSAVEISAQIELVVDADVIEGAVTSGHIEIAAASDIVIAVASQVFSGIVALSSVGLIHASTSRFTDEAPPAARIFVVEIPPRVFIPTLDLREFVV